MLSLFKKNIFTFFLNGKCCLGKALEVCCFWKADLTLWTGFHRTENYQSKTQQNLEILTSTTTTTTTTITTINIIIIVIFNLTILFFFSSFPSPPSEIIYLLLLLPLIILCQSLYFHRELKEKAPDVRVLKRKQWNSFISLCKRRIVIWSA